MITTEQLQGITRPLVDQILAAIGQPVTIRRPGQPDVTVQAVVYQLENTAQRSDFDDPEVAVIAWGGVFRHDAPVRTLPFTVITADGLRLTPDSPPENPVEQDVAVILHLLPLADRTRVEQLVFHVPGVGTVEDPLTGNLVPAPGEDLQVPARLQATTDPRVRDMVGADQAEVVLVGRWGTLDVPQARPARVRWGSRSPLTLDGQPGTLTIKLAYPDSDLAQEQQFGARFVAVWRTP